MSNLISKSEPPIKKVRIKPKSTPQVPVRNDANVTFNFFSEIPLPGDVIVFTKNIIKNSAIILHPLAWQIIKEEKAAFTFPILTTVKDTIPLLDASLKVKAIGKVEDKSQCQLNSGTAFSLRYSGSPEIKILPPTTSTAIRNLLGNPEDESHPFCVINFEKAQTPIMQSEPLNWEKYASYYPGKILFFGILKTGSPTKGVTKISDLTFLKLSKNQPNLIDNTFEFHFLDDTFYSGNKDNITINISLRKDDSGYKFVRLLD